MCSGGRSLARSAEWTAGLASTVRLCLDRFFTSSHPASTATFPHAPTTQPVRRGEQSSPDTAGKLLWRYQTGNEVQGQATVKKGVVYMGSDDLYMYALKASDGTLLWRYHTGYMGANITHPAVVNGIVYFGSGDNYVYALTA